MTEETQMLIGLAIVILSMLGIYIFHKLFPLKVPKNLT